MLKQSTPQRRDTSRLLLYLLIVLLLFIIAILLYFLLREPAPAVALCGEAEPIPAAERRPVLTPGGEVARGTQQIQGEVVVTGAPDQVRTVVQAVVDADRQFDGTACLNSTAEQQGDGVVGTLTLASDLYRLPAGADEGEFIRAFYDQLAELNDERDGAPLVAFADPNYVVGYYVEGDPSNGHSGIIGGLAAAQPGQLYGDGESLFRDQWIFKANPGIDLLNANNGRQVEATGAGSTVVIFDTAPEEGATLPETLADMEIRRPEMVPAFVYPPGDENCCELDVADHGVFAAGLVDAVAPESDIILIRVLNERGQGDLFTLLEALDGYLAGQGGSLERTIYNLSLGLGQQLEPPFDGYRDVLLDLSRQIEDGTVARVAEPAFPIPTFHSRLLAASEAGALIVAATGNDSLGTPALAAQLPAGYPPLLPVSGHAYTGEHSCFANAGGLTAPAGSGIVDLPVDPTQQRDAADLGAVADRFAERYAVQEAACQPALITKWCTALAGAQTGGAPTQFAACPLALVSTVTTDTYPEGYAYWIGTSFSTPLVAGLGALLMEAGDAAPDAVSEAIYCSTPGGTPTVAAPDAPLGAGPISVARALSERCLP